MSIDRHGLSVGIERLESEFFLSLKAIGKLTHADYETIPPIWRSHKMQFLTATILFLFITSSAYAESFGDYIGAEYVRNYDGDTITFNLREFHPIIGKGISVRVNGIDTPEIRGKCKAEKELARQAKELIGALLSKANKIDLLNLQRGKYFRLIADVIVDGINISDALIDADLAVRYDGGKKVKGWCAKPSSTKEK